MTKDKRLNINRKWQMRLIIFIFFLSAYPPAYSQYYNTGQEPASFKWNELKTYHFKFIYPESFSGQINRLAFTFEKAYDLIKGEYNEPILDNIPVIIHNHTINSNGYVAWAPKRIEIYPLPGQENIPMDHIEQLALHEITHVLQMSSMHRGISKTLSYIFGEQYTGALGIYTPLWFLEGDAIIAESAYSFSGRGRVPAFEKKLKALLLENNMIYSYDKMINGSLKDFTPNHYKFGYQMSAWAKNRYGEKVWQKPMDHVAFKPYSLNPFNLALKKYYRQSKEDIYFETMVYLRRTWREQEKKNQATTYKALNPDKGNEYINYYSPVIAGKDSIIAIKTSLYDIPAFVLIDLSNKKEKLLFKPGKIWPFKINYQKGTIVWAEKHKDPRWENNEYSVIKKYNIHSRKTKTLTKKTRLFAPDISYDGKYIITAESTEDNKNHLLIIDAENGRLITRIATPNNILPQYPSWSDDGSEIVFISFSNKGEGIMSYNHNTGAWTTYMNEGRDDLQSVRKYNNSVYYVSSISGIDNAFRLDENNNTWQLSSSRFGIKDISVSENELLFSDYKSSGQIICHIDPDKQIQRVSGDTFKKTFFIDSLDIKEKLIIPEEISLPSNYKATRFRKGFDLFRLHSWMPFYADIMDISFDDLTVSPGFMLMSQNHLSSLITSLGYQYSNGEHFLKSRLSWKAWYPAIDFDLSYGGTPAIIQDNNSEATPSLMYTGLSSNTTIYLPLHFTRGRFTQTIWPSINIRYSNKYIFDRDDNMFDYGQTLINSRLYLSNLHKMSARDIWPKYGQVLDIFNTRSLFDDDLYGRSVSIKTAVYLPGIFKNNGIRLRYQHEKQNFKRMLFNNRVSIPRGYKHIIIEKVHSLSADYAFNIAYPDFNIGQFIYINRIRNTLFYDYASGDKIYYIKKKEMIDARKNFSSVGTELLADFYLLRIPFKFSAGLQSSYMPYEKKGHFMLLFSIDAFGFAINKTRSPLY